MAKHMIKVWHIPWLVLLLSLMQVPERAAAVVAMCCQGKRCGKRCSKWCSKRCGCIVPVWYETATTCLCFVYKTVATSCCLFTWWWWQVVVCLCDSEHTCRETLLMLFTRWHMIRKTPRRYTSPFGNSSELLALILGVCGTLIHPG
jgi:hypothetical protein